MISPSFSTWKNKPFLPLLLTLFFCLQLTGMAEIAGAATKMLMLNPVRTIFTDRQRSVNTHVINNSEEPITYTISLVTMRKGENGKLYEPETETEEERLVKNMIRFSPRRATIEPGKRQVVKLMARKPKNLPPGEYQTRLRLSPLVPQHSPAPKPANRTGKKGMIDLDLIVDSTFPIIIQHGGLTAEVTPLSIALKEFPKAPAGIAADVTFSRSGDCSAFGNVFLTFTPADNSKARREIGRALGLAIYLPNTERTMTVPLTGVSRQELTGGTIRVAFQADTGVVNKRKRKRAQLRSKDFVLP